MNDIPVNYPYECTNHTTDDNAASLSRVCGSCDQVKNEQLQCGGLKNYSEGKEISKRSDSSGSLVDAIAVTGPCDVELETICIGHNASSKSSAIPQHGLSDYMHSPVTECAAVAIPVDKEHLEFTSSVPDSDEDHSMNDLQKPSAFIVYSEDDDPNNHILEFSNMLNEFGYDCEVDQYHGSDADVYCWGQWHEEMIRKTSQRENGSILYICSPTLFKACITRSSSQITMKYGHINNQSLNSLIEDPFISSHVIPVFLEQCDKRCIPTCLLRTHAYGLNFSSKVLKVFTPDVMISVRKRDDNASLFVEMLLNTPGLESFRSFLYRLRGDRETIKPSESVDIATLPSSMTSINNRQMHQLQYTSCQPQSVQAISTPEGLSHEQHLWIQPYQNHTPHNSCLTTPSLDLQHTQSVYTCTGIDWYSHDTVLPVHTTVDHSSFLLAITENFKQLISAAFCRNNVLRQLFVVIVILSMFFVFVFYVWIHN